MNTITNPGYSPWGKIQTSTKIAEGVFWVSTPSHGGLMVHKDSPIKLTGQAISKAVTSSGDWFSFEEDCRYAIPFFEHPFILRFLDQESLAMWQECADGKGYYPESMRKEAAGKVEECKAKAHRTDAEIRQYLLPTITTFDADYLLARGIMPDPDQYVRYLLWNEEQARRNRKDGDLITAAWGDWHTKRPGVCEVATADGMHHFVTTESYRALQARTDTLTLLSLCAIVPDVDPCGECQKVYPEHKFPAAAAQA